MKFVSTTAVITLLLTTCSLNASADEWQSLFDGETLDGWDGNPTLWSVEDGAITGRTTDETKLTANSFLVYQGGDVDNFELEFEYKIVDGNSGVQYRSFELPDGRWRIGGYQADFEAGDRFSGILYGEKYRKILALRGEVVELRAGENGNVQRLLVDQLGDSAEMQKSIKKEDWNRYRIVASGFRFEHFINGIKTIECVDNDLENRRAAGLLALQIHVGPAMTVQFRDIRLKKLP